MTRALRIAAVIALTGLMAPALAQDGGVKRTVLQRGDVPTGALHECIVGTAEIAAGAAIGRHTHPGPEFGYVAEGELELIIEGESPRRLKQGESYQIAAGRIHDARNTGSSPARALATWVVEKGKPLSTPAK